MTEKTATFVFGNIDEEGLDIPESEIEAYVESFYAAMDAAPEFVYVVVGDDGSFVGVASTKVKADTISDTFDGSTITFPAKIDDPQWGNRPAN